MSGRSARAMQGRGRRSGRGAMGWPERGGGTAGLLWLVTMPVVPFQVPFPRPDWMRPATPLYAPPPIMLPMAVLVISLLLVMSSLAPAAMVRLGVTLTPLALALGSTLTVPPVT